jgi:hypothetical protein
LCPAVLCGVNSAVCASAVRGFIALPVDESIGGSDDLGSARSFFHSLPNTRFVSTRRDDDIETAISAVRRNRLA